MKCIVRKVSSLALVTCLSVMLVLCCSACSGTTSKNTSTTPSTNTTSSSTTTTNTTSTTWPDNERTAGVPRPAFSATPISVIDQNGLTAITYSGISRADADTYLASLKDSGFTQVEADSNVSGTVSYVARNVNTKTHLSFSYIGSSSTLTISLDRYGM